MAVGAILVCREFRLSICQNILLPIDRIMIRVMKRSKVIDPFFARRFFARSFIATIFRLYILCLFSLVSTNTAPIRITPIRTCW